MRSAVSWCNLWATATFKSHLYINKLTYQIYCTGCMYVHMTYRHMSGCECLECVEAVFLPSPIHAWRQPALRWACQCRSAGSYTHGKEGDIHVWGVATIRSICQMSHSCAIVWAFWTYVWLHSCSRDWPQVTLKTEYCSFLDLLFLPATVFYRHMYMRCCYYHTAHVWAYI